jgi:hypothetical protein
MGKFEKGQTGNPGGRPRSKELRELCRTYTADAVKELGRLAAKAKGEMTRVIAIRELLDRSYGRPMQALEVAVDDSRPEAPSSELTHPEVIEALGAILTKAENELGLTPAPELTSDQRAKRLIDQPKPLPPYLYKALQASAGTRH